jgi:DNA-binding NarL/FixJ family response regulator
MIEKNAGVESGCHRAGCLQAGDGRCGSAAGRIKSELPAVPIVGLSMFEDQHIGKAMRAAGAGTFVSKTASSAALLKAIYGLDDEL